MAEYISDAIENKLQSPNGEEQILKAKKEQNEKTIKKMQAKAKKVGDNIKKKVIKKKPLTKKKKWYY